MGTESQRTRQLVEEKFGSSPTNEIILFERQDSSLGEADSLAYQAEVSKLLQPLSSKVDSINTYTTQPSPSYISRDKTATYATIVGKGTGEEIYAALQDFANKADQSKLKISIGGIATTLEQTTSQVGNDLARTELITLPILLILLIFFFGSIVAALIPLGMSLITIVGAFAIARFVTGFIAIDSYAINVITILGIGLSIDYALLSVNRFREEIAKGSVDKATRTIIDTSGRTIFFSGITVIACLLALLVFPLEFLHSVAIGVTSAVAMAILFTVVVLPSILQVIGKNINALKIPLLHQNSGTSQFWTRAANLTTKYPVRTLILGLSILAVALIPLSQFHISTSVDYRWVVRGSSAQYVSRALSENFDISAPSLTVLNTFSATTNIDEQITNSCELTQRLLAVDGVKAIISPTLASPELSCDTQKQLILYGQVPEPLKSIYEQNTTAGATRYGIILDHQNGSPEAVRTLKAIRAITPNTGELLVGGSEADAYDTYRAYLDAIPIAAIIIIISMFILLAIQLNSLFIPLQAILINLVSLAISFAAIVGVFQFGWVDKLTGWGTVDGIVMTPLVLIAPIAFGLAMDYSVFLYSRMREVYDKKNQPLEAIRQGIIKTGPIITAAAIMVFTVVIAFASSSVLIMQIIGIGLGVTVLVDAFFVRLILVPSIMTLVGKANWYAPRWLSKLRIRHE
ncbi:MMPL family transporter [Candidatus Saccharibacteria bacterium]|nr:MMPL family transporter [Candidatus Saccharibacteria bacterium]NCU40424.1 MMPL family transporter [Candidatus Saccharibacteria bacterium]